MNRNSNVLVQIKKHEAHFNPALKRIAKYILQNHSIIKDQRINELAKACNVSEATVTRFVKEIKLKGFQDFKIQMATLSPNDHSDLDSHEKSVYDEIKKKDSIEAIIEKVAFRNIETLKDTKECLDAKVIEKAVVAIEKADVIAIFCAGASTVAGQNAKMRFYRVGKHCLLFDDPAQQAITASLLMPSSLAIGISSSGRTKYIVDALKIAKNSGAVTMCITDSEKSRIMKYSDIKLFTATLHSSFFQDSMVSRMAQILITDILYASFAARHFDDSLNFIEKSREAVIKTIY
jgi:DNA-binding MurR/RpiR family transcriptional regulator